MNLKSLLSEMTLAEKIGQLNLVNPGGQVLTGSVANDGVAAKLARGEIGMMFGTASIEHRRQIQRVCVEQTRLRIPMLFASDVVHGYRTALPLPIAMSCAWDVDLVRRASHLAATEARGDGIDLTFAPMVDVTRDPRWGRVAEGFGESAFLAAKLSAASVEGFQGHRPDATDRMLACVKHFAGYGAADGGREYAPASLGPTELIHTHLPPFQSAIDAGAAAVMPGFHTLDRVPVTADRRLLQDCLRDQIRFGGVVISDYTAIAELVAHGIGENLDAAAAAINAGVDMDMVSELYHKHLANLVQSGRVDQTLIENACRRVLQLKHDAGLFADPFRYLDEGRAGRVIGCAEHRQTAAEIVSQSCVLLKNDNKTLPLRSGRSDQTLKRVALIGPLADDRANLPGTWSVSADVNDCVSILTACRELTDTIDPPGATLRWDYARGCELETDPTMIERLNVFAKTVETTSVPPETSIAEAVQTAERSDAVVMCLGEAREHSGECSSRTKLSLPDVQMQLLRAIAQTDKPVVLVLMAGRPLVLTDVMPLADAVLYAWYGGTMSGPGIASLLLGETSPSGRLTMSFPRRVGQIPVHHDALPTGRPLPPDRSFEKFKTCYLDEVNEPLLPFGFGLTYGDCVYETTTIQKNAETVAVAVNVHNQSADDCVEVVQCYVAYPPGLISMPTKSLVGFAKVAIAGGQSRRCVIEIEISSLAVIESHDVSNLRPAMRSGKYQFGVGPDSQTLQWQSIELS